MNLQLPEEGQAGARMRVAAPSQFPLLQLQVRSGRAFALTACAARAYGNRRRFPQGINRECGEDFLKSESAAAPATVSGEPFAKRHWATSPGRRRKAATREPGDLPSVVVTREHIGRGVLMGVELRRHAPRPDLVRGDVPRLPRAK